MKLEEYKEDFDFEGEIVDIFDSHIKSSIPMYEEIHSLVVNISEWFTESGSNVYDIGSSTGSLLQKIKNKTTRDCSYIGLDKSSDMIEFCSKNGIKTIKCDVTKGFDFYNSSFITSVLTLQFISEKYRLDILKDVYKGLNKGGCFILVEKVLSEIPAINNIYNDLLVDNKIDKGFDSKNIINKANSIRGVMKPLTLEENIGMLKESGFSKIDVFFKINNFVGILAIK